MIASSSAFRSSVGHAACGYGVHVGRAFGAEHSFPEFKEVAFVEVFCGSTEDSFGYAEGVADRIFRSGRGECHCDVAA